MGFYYLTHIGFSKKIQSMSCKKCKNAIYYKYVLIIRHQHDLWLGDSNEIPRLRVY